MEKNILYGVLKFWIMVISNVAVMMGDFAQSLKINLRYYNETRIKWWMCNLSRVV